MPAVLVNRDGADALGSAATVSGVASVATGPQPAKQRS